MKRQRKILFRFIFLLAIVYCFGINAYSNYNMQPNSVVLPTGGNSEENIFFSDVDFFDDEQINQIFEFITAVDSVYWIPFTQSCFLISRYPTSIWQPPKKQ